MPLSHSENWDGVTAPALPSNWNVSVAGQLITVGTVGSVAPLSSPNQIGFAGSAVNGLTYALTYATQDGNAGDVTVIGTGAFAFLVNGFFSVFARCSDATANYASSSLYDIRVDGAGGAFSVNRINAGTLTNVFSLATSALAPDTYYQVTATLSGGSSSTGITISLQRLTDSMWLNMTTGVFQPTFSQATPVDTSAIAGQGYAGLALNSNFISVDHILCDDWSIGSLAAPGMPPNKPIVVYFPYQFYPAYSE